VVHEIDLVQALAEDVIFEQGDDDQHERASI
jgi:hypothetical protein